MNPVASRNRRNFLRFLAGSPLIAKAWAQQTSAEPLKSAKDVLDVIEFEEIARRTLPPAHWGYVSTGVDDDATLKANMGGFKHIELRPRRLIDVSKVDMRTEIFGTTWESPLFLCPVGGQRMFHPDGEVGSARAAQAKKSLQILSTQTSISVEEVAKALGTPPWYQLYMPTQWDATEKLVKRAEGAGCPVLVWTVDLFGGRNTETATRLARQDSRNCFSCHVPGAGGGTARAKGHTPMFDGIESGGINPANATWEHVDRPEETHQNETGAEGHRDARGREAVPRAWRRWHPGVESRRPRDRGPAAYHRKPSRGD